MIFSMVHIASTMSVVHDKKKLLKISVYFFISCKSHQIIIDNSVIDLNTKLAVIYYNVGKTPSAQCLKWCHIYGLKDQHDQIDCKLECRDTRRMYNVKYQFPSIDSAGRVLFSQMKLRNDDDVRTMFSIFG